MSAVCKNCEHFRESIIGTPLCGHPGMMTDSRVHGKLLRRIEPAATQECDERGYFTAITPKRPWWKL